MPHRRIQTVVTVLSVVAALVGLALYTADRILNRPVPVWDVLLMAYGIVFCVFLWLHQVGRAAVRLRAQSDAERARARPRPVPAPGRRVPVPCVGPSLTYAVGDAAAAEASVSAVGGPGPVTKPAEPSTEVVLARVRREDESELQALLDAGVAEVLALDGLLPDLDSAGHVRQASARQWLETRGMHPFFVRWDGDTVGCCVVRELSFETRELLRVEMLYVRAEWRRRRLGTAALCKLAEFGRMTGATGMVVDVSPNNGRARRFLRACGFRLANPDQAVASTDAGRQERTESAAAPDRVQRREVWMLEW